MSDIDDKATVAGGGPHRRVEVRRVIHAPIREVWEAITDPEQVRQWWAAGEVTAQEGGLVRLQGSDDCNPGAVPLDGRVKVCLPPYVFEFTWNEAFDPAEGLVRFDLVEVDEQSTLVTLVNIVPQQDKTAAAAGWHVLMDRLRSHADGSGVPAEPDEAQLQALAALYA